MQRAPQVLGLYSLPLHTKIQLSPFFIIKERRHLSPNPEETGVSLYRGDTCPLPYTEETGVSYYRGDTCLLFIIKETLLYTEPNAGAKKHFLPACIQLHAPQSSPKIYPNLHLPRGPPRPLGGPLDP